MRFCSYSSTSPAQHVNRARFLLLVAALLLGLGCSALPAEQVQTPGLRQRAPAADRQDAGAAAPQGFDLPEDASGAYHFDRLNESIEIDFYRSHRAGQVKVSGYISRLGDAESDRNTPVTYFFDTAQVEGTELKFRTKVVHGTWYAFDGTIVRGPAEAREQDGYYILHGTLETHHPEQAGMSADETVERRTVNYRSEGGE